MTLMRVYIVKMTDKKIIKQDSNISWYTYILKCGDNSLYTGCTNNLEKRIQTHSSGKGAKYTRSHLPVKLVYSEKLDNRSLASKRESEIKKLPRKEKISLIESSMN